jgi:hypothetical protein
MLERDSPYTRLCDALRRHGPTLNLLYEYARTASDEEHNLREAFATAIAAVLHDVLRRFWKECGRGKHEWKTSGPLVHGCSVPQVISAAAKHNGKKHGLRTNGAWTLLEMLSERAGYSRIDARIREYAALLDTQS